MTTLASIKITTDFTDAGLNGLLKPDSQLRRESLQKLITFLHGLEGGQYAGTVSIVVGLQGGTLASGTLTIASNSAQSVSINGVTLTGGTDYVISGKTATQIAAEIVSVVSASSDSRLKAVSASSVAGVVTVKSASPGLVGNNIALAATGAASASGADLSGGTDPVSEILSFNR